MLQAARAGRPTARAMLRCLGYSATIAIAGCQGLSPQQMAQQERQRDYDDFYQHCLYQVTGPFAGASLDVMKECERQARNASGMSAVGQDPKGLEAKPASPIGNAETPKPSRGTDHG